jgi:hypothetical protein
MVIYLPVTAFLPNRYSLSLQLGLPYLSFKGWQRRKILYADVFCGV